MNRRLPTTLTDYVFWLINPALIMLLLDSFTFYLLEAHYGGEHKLRLLWAFAFYNMGIVACARISLIEGASAAEWLSVLLIVAMLVVVVLLSGSPFALLLIFVLAFLSFRLAKNTTILDDRDEASAMGLVGRVFAGTTKAQRDARARRLAGEPTGSSGVEASAATRAEIEAENDGPATPMSRLMARIRGQRVDETPGLSILYVTPFTLIAMGLSSWFLPPESRTYAHVLLALHLGCALTLLATATFLNLRRYLRQRMIQMPEGMTGLWVASSAIMLVGVLLAAMILPRPGLVEPLRSELFATGRDWLKPSDWSMPWDGTRGEAASNASGGDQDPQKSEGGGDASSGEPANGSASGAGEPAADGDGGRAPGGTSPGQQGEGGGENGEERGGSGSTSGESDGGQSGGGESSGQPSDPANQQAAAASQPDPSSSETGSSGETPSPETSPQGEAATAPAEPNDPFAKVFRDYTEAKVEQDKRYLETVTWQKFLITLRFLVMFAIWLVALAGAAYLVWRFRDMIFEAIELWWTQMREWFARILRWGDPAAVAADGSPMVVAAPARPFSAYADPFRSGAAAQWNLRDLLAYSLEALDAWSRDRQFPRGQGETPGEFASRLALREPATHASVVPFANVYAQAAFAPDGPPQNTIDVVRGLWSYLALSTGDFGSPGGQAPPPGSPAMRRTDAPRRQ